MLPRLSGIEVLKEIRKIAPNIIIVMLTGQSSKDSAIQALKNHADDYIEKPFEVDKMLITIRRLLDSKKGSIVAHLNKMERVKKFIEMNVDKKMSESKIFKPYL
jgi:DNA-binding response OmpR family regulator